MPDLGDIASVWSVSTFTLAALAGFSFGYLVVASISAQSKWRTDNSAHVYGWIVGVLAAWYLTILTASQIIGALIDGDFLWQRIVSRLGPYLVAAMFTGIGTWRGLKRADKR